jgi:hypothetical protein
MPAAIAFKGITITRAYDGGLVGSFQYDGKVEFAVQSAGQFTEGIEFNFAYIFTRSDNLS